MSLKVGDSLPSATFRMMGENGPEAKTSDELFRGRRVVLFAVPGAFTPTCHRNHLPGFIEHHAEIMAKGIDEIFVTAVNDVFVMDAWAKASGAEGKITFLADGNAEFAKAAGLIMDGTAFGLGTRSQRYVSVINDGIVEYIAVEDSPANAEISGAKTLLESI